MEAKPTVNHAVYTTCSVNFYVRRDALNLGSSALVRNSSCNSQSDSIISLKVFMSAKEMNVIEQIAGTMIRMTRVFILDPQISNKGDFPMS
jgi:hypothetical protein